MDISDIGSLVQLRCVIIKNLAPICIASKKTNKIEIGKLNFKPLRHLERNGKKDM